MLQEKASSTSKYKCMRRSQPIIIYEWNDNTVQEFTGTDFPS